MYMCICVYVYMCICVYVYVYIHIYIYIYTYIVYTYNRWHSCNYKHSCGLRLMPAWMLASRSPPEVLQ